MNQRVRTLLATTAGSLMLICCINETAQIASAKKAKAAAAPAPKVFKIKISKEIVMGDQLMAKGKYAEAGELYRQAINNDPKSLPGYLGFGMALAKQFKLDGAAQTLDKALALDPGNPVALSGKAMVDFNRLQSSSVTVQKNKDNILKQAEQECKDGLAKDPGMPEAHNTLGMIYKEQGRIPESINEFKEAIKLDPTYSEPYANLGVVQLNNNETDAAIENFKQAIANASGNSTAHYGLGKAYLRKGQLDDAIKELNTSLGMFSNSAPCHLSIGEAYAAQGNTLAAVKEFQESIRIKPENVEAYMHIADIRENRGDLELSIGELRSALELFPNSTDLRMRIADECLALEKLDDAAKEYKKVLDTNPSNDQAVRGLTRCCYLKAGKEATGAYFVSNDYESASRYIDQAVSMNPNDMELRLAQAKLKIMSGANVDLSQIGTPKNDGERIAYAEALIAQNKFKEEEEQLNTVIANASDPKQCFAVADLALMIKDLPSAEAAYKKAATMPNSADRAKRGLDAVAKAKDTARQDVTLANDLSSKKQYASAIDKYRNAIAESPKMPEARLGLAQTLEQLKPPTSKDLRESVQQYRVYLSFGPTMTQKDLTKLNKKLDMLDSKAAKLELKEKSARAAKK
jgi:tetratricopeptide (TPR) repeat protein